MNTYTLQRGISSLSEALANWFRTYDGKKVLPYKNEAGTELRLTSLGSTNNGTMRYIDQPGCTLTLNGLLLHISCAPSVLWIEKAVLKGLRKAGVCYSPILTPKPLVRTAIIQPPIQCPQAKPVPTAKAKKTTGVIKNAGTYATVEEACKAAERDSKGWIVFTNRARDTASESNYDDPDYVYRALVALGQAAFLNSKGGLGQSWEFHLKKNGPHQYCAHSSEGALAQFPGEYHVNHESRRYCIESHIKRGNGSGSDSVRIYVCKPQIPGQPVIIGSVGLHLPIPTRGH